MKASTLISTVFAVAAVTAPVSATLGPLFAFCDLAETFKEHQWGTSTGVDQCQPPKVVTCGSEDTTDYHSKRFVDEEKRTLFLVPAAVCAVSEVIKLKEELFEVVINFELAKFNFIFSLLGNIVSKLHFTGTGCDDGIFTLIDKKVQLIEKWTQWSSSIVVKPVKVNGMCCLPDDLKLNVEFGGSGSIFGWFCSIFQKKFSWSFSKASGSFEDFDIFSDFFSTLSAREQEEILANDKRGVAGLRPHQQKRFLSFLSSINVFKSISTSGTTFKNFCWECDC